MRRAALVVGAALLLGACGGKSVGDGPVSEGKLVVSLTQRWQMTTEMASCVAERIVRPAANGAVSTVTPDEAREVQAKGPDQVSADVRLHVSQVVNGCRVEEGVR